MSTTFNPTNPNSTTLLKVENLSIEFSSQQSKDSLVAVRNLSFELQPGETLALVGESGCGKSVTSFAIAECLPPSARISQGSIQRKSPKIAVIFQDPMSALNPCLTIETQISEVLKHSSQSKSQTQAKIIELLDSVGITDSAMRLKQYPHELSGGMCQRIMIAIALAQEPDLLIADEPTTALDVTIQAQILNLLKKIQRERHMSMIFVSHDLDVVSFMADRILVMYAGEGVEIGTAQEIAQTPAHPYTQALIQSLPSHQSTPPFFSIAGTVPPLNQRPQGCQFHPRCPWVQPQCMQMSLPQVELSSTHSYLCFHSSSSTPLPFSEKTPVL
jgi:oligopeptide/dipeptide ABC transporter ATP-binding protein